MESTQLIADSDGDDLPLVFLHRLPKFNFTTSSLAPLLKAPARWVDPVVESEQLVSSLRSSVRVLVSVENAPVNSQVLDQYPALECVVCMSTGLNHVDVADCHRRGIKLTNAGDAFSDDVADYAVALLIDVMRQISAGDRFVRAGYWSSKGDSIMGTKVRKTLIDFPDFGVSCVVPRADYINRLSVEVFRKF